MELCFYRLRYDSHSCSYVLRSNSFGRYRSITGVVFFRRATLYQILPFQLRRLRKSNVLLVDGILDRQRANLATGDHARPWPRALGSRAAIRRSDMLLRCVYGRSSLYGCIDLRERLSRYVRAGYAVCPTLVLLVTT